jgi:hypothetical protein
MKILAPSELTAGEAIRAAFMEYFHISVPEKEMQ